MDLIIAPNTVPLAGADAPPTTGTPGYATDGTAGAGYTDATDFPAYHYNGVVEELMNVITAGGQTPSRANTAQLLAALEQLFGPAAFPSGVGVNGWKKIPDPNSPSGYFILQWGNAISVGSGTRTQTITLPIAFPNVCLACNGNDIGAQCYSYGLDVASASTLIWTMPAASLGASTTPAPSANCTIRWFAIGK